MPEGRPSMEALKRSLDSPRAWEAAPAGLWAWVLQRVSAVLVVVLVGVHLWMPWSRPLRLTLLATVILHAVLGIRVIILDFARSVRIQKVLLVVLVGLGAVLLALLAYILP